MQSVASQKPPGVMISLAAVIKPAFWLVFGLMTLSAFLFSSLPILKPSHPMHALLSSQRWLLFPHIAGGLVALILGPLQFSNRLRQRHPARHRLLGKIYIGAVLLAAPLAAAMARGYPAFFPWSVGVNALLWLLTTIAAFLTARNRRFDQHRRWMARSYAMASTFVLPRVPVPIAAYTNMSLEASSYALLLFSLVALMTADLIVDFSVFRNRSVGVC